MELFNGHGIMVTDNGKNIVIKVTGSTAKVAITPQFIGYYVDEPPRAIMMPKCQPVTVTGNDIGTLTVILPKVRVETVIGTDDGKKSVRPVMTALMLEMPQETKYLSIEEDN